MATERTYKLTVMLSPDEGAWLEAHATERGLTASDVIRLYIREQRPREPEKPTKKKH